MQCCGPALRASTIGRQENRQIGKSGLTIPIQVTAIIKAVRGKQHRQISKANRTVAVEVSRAWRGRVVTQDIEGQGTCPLVLGARAVAMLSLIHI